MQSVVDWFVVVVCNNCWSPVEFVSSLVLMIQSVVLCLSVCLCVRRQPVSISHQLKLICLFQPRSWWYSTPIYRYLSVTANTCYWAMLLLLLPLLLLMMMMYAASAWEYIWIYVIMGPSFLEGGPIMYRCCPSVCLSVRLSICPSVCPVPPIEGKRKGLRIPNLVGRVLGTRAPRGPISRSRGQRSRSQDTVVVST